MNNIIINKNYKFVVVNISWHYHSILSWLMAIILVGSIQTTRFGCLFFRYYFRYERTIILHLRNWFSEWNWLDECSETLFSMKIGLKTWPNHNLLLLLSLLMPYKQSGVQAFNEFESSSSLLELNGLFHHSDQLWFLLSWWTPPMLTIKVEII